MDYRCDWTYPRAPRCTVVLDDAPFVADGPTRGQYLFCYRKFFRDAGWTIVDHRAYCRIHRDSLQKPLQPPVMNYDQVRRPLPADPIGQPGPPPLTGRIGQGMVRPFLSSDQLAARISKHH
jgi:hypothetical protein